MIRQSPGNGARSLWVERSSDATTYPVAWRLFTENGVDYYARQMSDWTWAFHRDAGQPPDEQHELQFASPSLSLTQWPSDKEISMRAYKIYQDHQDWLRTYLRWFPLLIASSSPPSACSIEVCRWRALLAVISAEVAYLYTDPDLDETRRHLTRLAYCTVADYYEIETDPATPQRYILSSLRRWLHRWQSMLSKVEGGGLSVTGSSQWMNPPNTTDGELPKDLVYSFKPEVDLAGTLENGMQEVLFMAHMPSKGANERIVQLRLRRFFRQEKQGQRFARELVRRWWLPRYDLDGAEKIKQAIRSAEDDPKRGGYLSNWSWVAQLSRWTHRLLFGVALMYVALFVAPTLSNWSTTWLVYLAYGLGVLQIPHWIWNGRPDTSLPRLRAGMFLAVVGTVLQQDWDNLLDFSYRHPIAMLVIAVLLTLVSFQVLFSKITNTLVWEGPFRTEGGVLIRNHVAQVWLSPPFQRSCFVLRRELTRSFLFSIVLVDLIGGSYVQQEHVTALTNLHLAWPTLWAPGVLSMTYPALVLFFSAILLFAGIFSEILWDERPMTEALV